MKKSVSPLEQLLELRAKIKEKADNNLDVSEEEKKELQKIMDSLLIGENL